MQRSDARRHCAPDRASWWAALVLAALLLGAAPGCGREPTAPKPPPQSLEEARRLVAEGNEHYGRWVQPESVGDDSELHAAIDCLETALRFLTEDEHPDDWARAHYLLAQCHEAGHGASRDIEQAIEHCQSALRVYTEESHPEEWAKTEHLLGECYFDGYRDIGRHREAIPHYQAALRVFQEETHPYFWADTNYLLGRCYERSRNIEKALEHAEAAYQAFRKISDPSGPYLRSKGARLLARCYLRRGDIEGTIARYEAEGHRYEEAGDEAGKQSCLLILAEIKRQMWRL